MKPYLRRRIINRRKNPVTLDQIVPGKVLYVVSDNGWIEKLIVESFPYKWHSSICPGYFHVNINTKGLVYGHRWHRSLSDIGVIPNTYNDHKCFNNLAAAEKYVKKLSEGGFRMYKERNARIDREGYTNFYELDSYYDFITFETLKERFIKNELLS